MNHKILSVTLASLLALAALLAISCGGNGKDVEPDADTVTDPEIDQDTAETIPDADAEDVGFEEDAQEDPIDVPSDEPEEPTEIRVTVSDLLFRGPNGGEVTMMKADPSNPLRIYAIVSETLFVSLDDGTTWNVLPVGDEPSVNSIELLDDGTLFAGGFPYVYRSDDNGTSWDNITYDLGLGIVMALEYKADPEPKLWAGLDAAPSGEPVVWSITPGDTSWTSHDIPSGLGDISINDFETSVVDTTKLFVTYEGAMFSGGGGIYCYDAGGSPSGDCGGLPDRPFYRVHAYNDLVLVAGGHVFGTQTAGVYSSADDAASWSLESSGWVDLYAHEAIRLADGSLMAASYSHGIMMAASPGTEWSPVPAYDGFSFKSVLETASGRLLAGMEVLGIVAKDPDGEWAESSTGIRLITINDACIDPDNASRILGVSSGLNTGMPLFTPGGVDEWAVIESLPNPRYSAAYIAPSGRWFVAMDGPVTLGQDGVYVSEDEGGSFDFLGPLTEALMDHDIFDIYESDDGADLFVAGNHFSPATPLIMHSSDAGENWAYLYESAEACQVARIAESGNNLIFPLSCELGGIVRVAPDLTAELLTVTGSFSGAMDAGGCKTDEDTMYAIGRRDPDDYFSLALFSSGDGGETWNYVDSVIDLGILLHVAVHPLVCDLVFVSGTAGAALSEDGGATWTFLEGSDGLRSINRLRTVYTTGYDAVLILAGEGGVMTADLVGEAL